MRVSTEFVLPTSWRTTQTTNILAGRRCSCGKPVGLDGKTCAGKHPAHNWEAGDGVFVYTGAVSGIFVVDSDSDEAEQFLVTKGVPSTLRVRTGSMRGYHRYYRHPGFNIWNSVGKLAPKIDVRGDGGGVVGPGSPHADGGKYTVVDDVPIADAPAWLLEWLRNYDRAAPKGTPNFVEAIEPTESDRDARIRQATFYLKKAPLSIRGGGGRDVAFTVASVLVRKMRLPTDLAADLWEAHYNPRLVAAETTAWERNKPTGCSITERLESARATGSVPAGAPELGDGPDLFEQFTCVADQQAKANPLGVVFGGWDREPDPVEFLVDGLLPRGSVSKWFGHGDSLKTWLCLSLAVAVSRGERWLDQFATNPGRVVVIDFETGSKNLHRRLNMLGAGDNSNLGAASMPGLKTDVPKFWNDLAKLSPDLVIIDSLRAGNPDADENSSTEAIKPLLLAGIFAEKTGASVAFIHHAKKGDGEVIHRGSAAIRDQVDCSFTVKAEGKDPVMKRVTVTCDKPGDMRTPPPFVAEVRFDDVLHTATIRATAAATGEVGKNDAQRVLDALEQSGPFTTVDLWRQAAGIGKKRFNAAKDSLIGDGSACQFEGKWMVDDEQKRDYRMKDFVSKSDTTYTIEGLAKQIGVHQSLIHDAMKRQVIAKVGAKASSRWAVL